MSNSKPSETTLRVDEPFVSIVIPTRNSSSNLPRLLQSIEAQGYHRREVIVVDNNSSDATSSIATDYGCTVLHAGPERSNQRNTGALTAHGDFLLFVDSDMELAPGLLETCIRVSQEVDGVCIRETTIGDGYWVRVRSFERSRYFRTNLFEAARGFWRDVFSQLGGYDATLTGLEDYDLHARFVEMGFRLGWVETPLFHHEEGLTLSEYLRKRAYYGRTDRRYAARYPQRWREQRSLMRRIQYVLGGPMQPADLILLPGLAIMRGLERLVRARVS